MRISDWSSDVCSSDLASAFLPPHKVRNRWDYHYIRSKLSTDPLYPGALRALRGSTAPVMDLGCGLGLLAHALRQDGQRSEERRVGKSVSVRVDLGGRRIIKKKKHRRRNVR